MTKMAYSHNSLQNYKKKMIYASAHITFVKNILFFPSLTAENQYQQLSSHYAEESGERIDGSVANRGLVILAR